jgi:cell division transport system permease protein
MNMQIRAKKNSLRFATVIVLTASFAVLQMLSLFALNLQNVLTMWGQQLQVNVYLSEQATPEQTTQIQNFLKNSDRIDHVEYVSSQKALSTFKDQMASYAPDLLKDNDLLKVIPSSLQFSLSDKVATQDQASTMKSLAEQLKTQAGVDDVSYGQDWVKAYSSLVIGIRSAVGLLILAIGGAALFVISNVIRQSIHQRRDAIEVLELVGATASFIRKPFLKEGALLALISGSLALGSSVMLFSWLQKSLASQLQFFQLASSIHFFSVGQSLMILGLSTVLGFFASYLCLRSLNDGWAASQRVNDRG